MDVKLQKMLKELISSSRQGDAQRAVIHLRNFKEASTAYHRRVDWECLHSAAIFGHSDTCKALIENGVDVNVTNDFQQTALMFASGHTRLECCRLLIEKGADVNALNNQRKSILYQMCASENLDPKWQEVGILLVNAGADPAFVDPDSGRSCLHAATGNRLSLLALRILQAGADVNATCRLGQTALHAAAEKNVFNVVAELILHGAKMYGVNDLTPSPLQVAVSHGTYNTSLALVAAGAHLGDPKAVLIRNGKHEDRFAVTRLHASVRFQDTRLIAATIDSDPDPQSLPGRLEKEYIRLQYVVDETVLDDCRSLMTARMARLALADIAQSGLTDLAPTP